MESNVLPAGPEVVAVAAISGSDHPGQVEQFGWPEVGQFGWPPGAGAGFSHWALVIGLERDARGAFTAILLLDPSVPPPTLALFNARVELVGRRARYAKSGEESCPVRLIDLVVVRRAT